MIGNIFQMIYTMVDTIVVSKFVGTTAFASVGAASPVIDLLLGLVIGLTNGLSIMIAQKIGAGNPKETKKSMINGFYLVVMVSLLIMGLGFLFNHALFQITHVADEQMRGAMTYSRIIFAGALSAGLYNYESAILRANGDSITPLLFLIISSLLNIASDLFFVSVLPV